jgi:hypothetical protein
MFTILLPYMRQARWVWAMESCTQRSLHNYTQSL